MTIGAVMQWLFHGLRYAARFYIWDTYTLDDQYRFFSDF